MLTFHPIEVQFGIEPGHRAALDRRFWVRGEFQFDDEANTFSQSAVIAYLEKGRWFFTPPNFDPEWETRTGIPNKVNFDVSSSLKVFVPRDCPLEIVDLSVMATRMYAYGARRIVTFKLHNKSRTDITGLSFRIERVDGEGSSSRGMPFRVKAGETVLGPDDVSYPGKVYYCEEEALRRFIIQDVSFKDGSEWRLKRSLTVGNRR